MGEDRREMVFFDGRCGLCHRAVRFVLPRDEGGRRFVFAPLHGATFHARLSEAQRATLPESLVVISLDGSLLSRSEATAHILGRLGGGWALMGGMLGLVPRPIRNWGYDRIAALRHRWFEAPSEACPIVPAEYRGRFLP